MRTTRELIESPHFTVRVVACMDDHARWSAPETTAVTQVVLIRRGRFQVRADGRGATADPNTGYLHPPHREISFAHPAGGDVCTSIAVPGHSLTSGIDLDRARTIRGEPAHVKHRHRGPLSAFGAVRNPTK